MTICQDRMGWHTLAWPDRARTEHAKNLMPGCAVIPHVAAVVDNHPLGPDGIVYPLGDVVK